MPLPIGLPGSRPSFPIELLVLDQPARPGIPLPGRAPASIEMLEHHQPFAAAHLRQIRSIDHPIIR